MCINPVKKVHTEAVLLSGLDNFMLENENRMGQGTLTLISAFMDNLQQPLVLIAHNGRGFDFPLLARSFKDHNTVILSQKLHFQIHFHNFHNFFTLPDVKSGLRGQSPCLQSDRRRG